MSSHKLLERAETVDLHLGDHHRVPAGSRKLSILQKNSDRVYCKRLVDKDGQCNISHHHPSFKTNYWARDFFNSLVELKWRWLMTLFASAFLTTWTLFALAYYMISFGHGDIGDHPSDWPVCINNLNSFTSAFLFSLESQHTIGYGFRYINDECPMAIATLSLQSILGLIAQSILVGIMFTKLAKAANRSYSVIFSRNACVGLHDGKLTFSFRVGDLRKSHIIDANLRLMMVKKHVTKEGLRIGAQQFSMQLGEDSIEKRILLVWPVIAYHEIDEQSPLYNMTQNDLANNHYEIIAILEGSLESTGNTIQVRTSYLPHEVMWNKRFNSNLLKSIDMTNRFQFDYSQFDDTESIATADPIKKDTVCIDIE